MIAKVYNFYWINWANGHDRRRIEALLLLGYSKEKEVHYQKETITPTVQTQVMKPSLLKFRSFMELGCATETYSSLLQSFSSKL